MSLGATLKSAREAKGLTVAELANELHLKMQIVEDLENDDFQNITASIYGRGFIKLCADRLGVDPAPLLEEFKQVYQKPSHETAPYGTPEYRRQEELAKARAAANVASSPPRRPTPIVPAEPVDIPARVIPASGSAVPGSVTVSPAVPVESAPVAPAPAAPAPETPAAPPPVHSAPVAAVVTPASDAEDALFRHPSTPASAPAAAPAPTTPEPSMVSEHLLFPLAAPRAATVSVDPPRESRPRTGMFVPPTRQSVVPEPEQPAPTPPEKKLRREGPGPIRRACTALGTGLGKVFSGLGAFFSRNARTVAFGVASLLMVLLAVWAIVGIRSAIHAHRERVIAAHPSAPAQAHPAAQGASAVWTELILPPPVLFAE